MWTKDLKEFEEFEPIKRKYTGMSFPPFIFRGYVRVSEANDQSKAD